MLGSRTPILLFTFVGAALVATPSHHARAQAATARDGAPLVVSGRSVVTTKLGIVATSQPLASAAGAAILAQGGNAIDAAIAANAVLGLTEPMMSGIGGDLFAIVYEAKTGKVYGLNASGWAASGVTAELVASKSANGRMPQRGVWSVTVPGAVAGWEALRTRFGTMSYQQLLAPAIHHAEAGFPVGEITARLWLAGERVENAAFKQAFLLNGKAPRSGEEISNPDMAKTLRRIAAQGPKGFYEGETARAILSTLRAEGGTMTAADLSEFAPEWVNTITTDYRGWTVHEIPPNSQGLAALMMLNIMERYPVAEHGWLSPKSLHMEIEAKKLAYADLLRYIGDPRFSKQPVEQLLSREHAAARAALIDPARANCRVEPAMMSGIEEGESETVYLSTIDQDGNIVSLIQSIYSAFGSGIVAPGTGFALHNRGGLFTLEPGRPNTIAPRKRPLHTIIPAFMEKGDVKIGFGIMGGWNQSQAHAQFVRNIADFGMDIQQALEASRFSKRTFDGCDVEIEDSVPADVIAALRALGHEIRLSNGRQTDQYGYGQAVMSNGKGIHFGASEPRHDGFAAPQPAIGVTPSASAQPTTRAAQLRELDAYIAKGMTDWEIPGLSISVVHNDTVVYSKGFGVRQLGAPGAVDDQTLFGIMSTTKAITALGMALLVDDGKLKWDDPVTKWVPEFQFPDVFTTREATVKDLLTHNLGLGNADLLWARLDLPRAEIFRRVRFLDPAYSLRGGFTYQNVMYGLAGEVIARASGMSWSEFTQRRILTPLGMTRTYTSYAAMRAASAKAGGANQSLPHYKIRDTIRVIGDDAVDEIPEAGAIWSTAVDMAKWTGFLLDSGRVRGERLVSEAQYRELLKPQSFVDAGSFYPTARITKPHWTTYGLGWFQQDYRGRFLAFHTGSLDGRTAIIGLLPDARTGVFIFGNMDHAEFRHALMLKTLDIFAGTNGGQAHDWSGEFLSLYTALRAAGEGTQKAADAKRVMGTRPTLPLAQYAGTYTHPAWGDLVITLVGDALQTRIGLGAQNAGPLAHWNYDTFRATLGDGRGGSTPLTFVIDPEGKATKVRVFGGDDYAFTRR